MWVFKLLPGALGALLVFMMQVKPSDAVANFCDWSTGVNNWLYSNCVANVTPGELQVSAAILIATTLILLILQPVAHFIIKRRQRMSTKIGPATYSDKDTALIDVVAWVALRSSWGRWQAEQRGGNPSENMMMQLASSYVLKVAGNGDLLVRGRVTGTQRYEEIDRHFWLQHLIMPEPDPSHLWKAVVYERPTNSAIATAYDSYLVEQAKVQTLWPQRDLKTDWLSRKIQMRRKANEFGKSFEARGSRARTIIVGTSVIAIFAFGSIIGGIITKYIPSRNDMVSAPLTKAPVVRPEIEISTAPSDVPKKIAAIDQARQIMHADVQNTLNEGFRILEEGRQALSKGERNPLMTGIPAFYQTWANLGKKIDDFRKANDGFEDISAILDQSYRPQLEKGFSSLQGAVGSLGDPPYKFDMNFFFQPHVQDFTDGMMEWGKWMHSTDAKLLALRKRLSK